MPAVALQNYMPLNEAREFSPEENRAISTGENQWISRVAPGYRTPLPALLSSPSKGFALSTTAGGAAGAVGGIIAASAKLSGGATWGRALAWMGGIAGGGILLGALSGVGLYFARRQRNDDVIEMMRRLPPGATRRDMLADPVVQRDLDRVEARRAMGASAADAALLGTVMMGGMMSSGLRSSRSGR